MNRPVHRVCNRPTSRRAPLITCVLLAFGLLPLAVNAQSTSATLSGTITDQNGAIVPGAKIMIVNIGTRLERDTNTNSDGYFTVPLLPPGNYKIRVEAQGFAPAEIESLTLNVGDNKALTIQLKAGDINAAVQITSEAPLISESPAVGTVVDRQFVANMPLNGRSFQNLIDLSPGVIPSTGRGQFNVNGQRSSSNYITVDGVNANIGGAASSTATNSVLDSPGSAPATSVTGGFNGLLSVDALQEFKIQTSTYAPEFGRLPGAQISLISRSGTNLFHGTLSEYVRNDKFDANDWFANQAGLERAQLRQNDFGGVVGGPIWIHHVYDGRNRSFFFFSYEGLRLRIPVSGTTTVPSNSLRHDASVSAALRPFLNAFPIPNGHDFGNGGAEFSFSSSNPATIDSTSLRIDQTLTKSVTIFGRYSNSPSRSVTGNFNPAPRTSDIATLTVGSTQLFGSKISNELLVNYSRSVITTSRKLISFGGSTPFDQSLIFPSPYTAADSYSFTLLFDQNQVVGFFPYGNFITQNPRHVNLVDNLSLVTGSHQLKFGVDYRYLFPHIAPYKYLSVLFIDVLGSRVRPGSSIQAGQPMTMTLSNFSVYGQDTWRLSPRLTLTYGLRWDVNTPPKGEGGTPLFTAQGVDNPAAATIAPAGTPLFKTTYDSIAPRIGISYMLRNKAGSATLLRGGFGVFSDASVGYLSAATASSPYASTKFLSNVPFPLTPANAAPLPVGVLRSPYTLYATAPGFKLPYSLQWNLAVEQSLGSQQSISATYLGSADHRLLRLEGIDNPNSSIGLLNLFRSAGFSNYRALQFQYKRRLSHGLQALVSYSWARSKDTGSVLNALYEFPLSAGNSPKNDLGPSDFDIRHAFKGAFTYNIPSPFENRLVKNLLKDFSLDVLFIAQSALPVNVTTGTDLSTFVSARPNLIPGVPLYIGDPTAPGGRIFNNTPYTVADNARLQALGCRKVGLDIGDPETTPIGPAEGAFCTPNSGQGNFPRNGLRGFPLSQIDLALNRQFKIGERLSLQLRGEVFNLFNHPNFSRPSGSLDDGQFGRTSAMLNDDLGGLNTLYQLGGPRSMQFGLKINF